MPDALFQLGSAENFPAIKTTLDNGTTVIVPVWLIAGLRSYAAVVMNSPAGASKNHILLMNGAGSGRKVRIWDIKVNPNITGNVTASALVLSGARTSNAGTGGTNQPIRKLDTADDTVPSDITCVSNPNNPTITSNELTSCTLTVEETTIYEGRATMYKADSVISAITLNQGEGFLIQQGTFAGVGAVNIFIYFTFD